MAFYQCSIVTLYRICTVFNLLLLDAHIAFNLENYTQGQLKVTKMKLIYDILLMFNSHYLICSFQVLAIRRCTCSNLTLKIVLKVKLKANKMNHIYDFLLKFGSLPYIYIYNKLRGIPVLKSYANLHFR